MKRKKGYNLHKTCGENLVIAEGRENIDLSVMISMNESAAYLWNAVEGKEFTTENLADLLCEEYEVERETALKDAELLVKQWLEAGIVEE